MFDKGDGEDLSFYKAPAWVLQEIKMSRTAMCPGSEVFLEDYSMCSLWRTQWATGEATGHKLLQRSCLLYQQINRRKKLRKPGITWESGNFSHLDQISLKFLESKPREWYCMSLGVTLFESILKHLNFQQSITWATKLLCGHCVLEMPSTCAGVDACPFAAWRWERISLELL